MAIYGLQAWSRICEEHEHDKFNNLTDDFIAKSRACIDYFPEEAGAYHQIFKTIKIGDIIYLKNCDWKKRELRINAIGIVTDNEMVQEEDFKIVYNCLKEVKWFQLASEIVININKTAIDRKSGDPYTGSVFGITLYEEYNPYIQNMVLDEIFKRIE